MNSIYDSWEFCEESPVIKINDIFPEVFLTRDKEIGKHENDSIPIFMPNNTGKKITELRKRVEIAETAQRTIANSENILYSTILTYKVAASRDDAVLAREKKEMLDFLNLLSGKVIPILQDMHQKTPVYGTEIEMLYAVAHFQERYCLPHVHFLYLAPKPEIVILCNGLIRHLSTNPITDLEDVQNE